MLSATRRALSALVPALVAILVTAVCVSCGFPTFAFNGGDAANAADATVDDDGLSSSDATVLPDEGPDEAATLGDAGVEVSADVSSSESMVDAALDAPLDAGSEVDCPLPLGGDPCTTIYPFTAAVEVLDGDPSDFCGIPASTLTVDNAPYTAPSPAPAGIDTVAYTRVGWSSDALHIHVHVTQAQVYTPLTTEDLWYGDAVEIFAAGYSPLTGSYSAGNDVGALQVIIVPPGDGRAARAKLYLGEVLVNDFDPSRWGARTVPGGYEVELELPWNELQGTPASGVAIAFDVAIDVRQNATNPTPLVQLVQGLQTVSPTTCAPDPAHPACDDRTWCYPTLQ